MDPKFTKFLELSGLAISESTNLTPILADYWNFTTFAAQYPQNIVELNFIKWHLHGRQTTITTSSPALQFPTPQPQQINTPITPLPLNPTINYPSPQPQQQISTPSINHPSPQPQQQISTPSSSPLNMPPTSPAAAAANILTPEYTPLPEKLQKLKKHVNTVEGQFHNFSFQKQEPENETVIIDENSGTENNTGEQSSFPVLNTFDIDTIIGTENIPMVYTSPPKHRGKDIAVAQKKFYEDEENKTEQEKKTHS
ncbi:Hypothetical predicted protein [Paramuricea clavata]|uniref:Uncharacterized protein n=1 Tax=Paramuricea clavata TaxID=317549 RepID=A0A6S7JER9_PARCT|nr:Hypothetical predicted protein [Paramuricea clavata]